MLKPVPGLAIEQQPATVLSRMLMWGEARGEPALGRLAVLAVAYNRAKRSDTSLHDVILKPMQFSSFNPDDPNRGRLLDAWMSDPTGWAAIDAIAELFEGMAAPDPTHGATHYYVLAMPNPPKWGRGSSGWDERAVIGRHVFGVTR